MNPVGYMAKRISSSPDWLKAHQVADVYSVSSCVSDDFADYINFWKHNGYWFFDSPEIIRSVALENSISLEGARLFYYEAHEMEFTGNDWQQFLPEPLMRTDVLPPVAKTLEGFDIVTFFARNSPECSPLSCNGLAKTIPTNAHCLIDTFDQAKAALDKGQFNNSEPGPYRIFAVYSVNWPQSIESPAVL